MLVPGLLKAKSVNAVSFFVLGLTLVISSCKKEVAITSSDDTTIIAGKSAAKPNADGSGNGNTVTEMPFTATLLIAYCWGENVRISGTIVNHQKTVSTPNGNHFTRHWTVKGLTGVGLTSGDAYIVTGGAEMFSVKDAVLNPNGTLNLTASLMESDILIHKGQIMLQNTRTGKKVLARHDIQLVPGKGLMHNRWLCGGGGSQ
jgi:hypothetical protein